MSVIEIYPYVDEQGVENEKLVQHKSDDGKRIIQLETGRIYDEAIDLYPSKYTYAEVMEPDEKEPDGSIEAVDNAN